MQGELRARTGLAIGRPKPGRLPTHRQLGKLRCGVKLALRCLCPHLQTQSEDWSSALCKAGEV